MTTPPVREEDITAAAMAFHYRAFNAEVGSSACGCTDPDEHAEKWLADVDGARAALDTAVPGILTAAADRLKAAVSDECIAICAEAVTEATEAADARVAELKAALRGLLGAFRFDDGRWRTFSDAVDRDQLARLQAVLDGGEQQ